MDYSLVQKIVNKQQIKGGVLILVVMDYSLVLTPRIGEDAQAGLNPCCNGL